VGRPLYFAAVVFSSFFLACSRWSESGCLSYFHTWCGRSANLECMFEICCTRLTENTGWKNCTKNRHLCTIVQCCPAISSQLWHVSTIRKKLVKPQYFLHMSSHDELRPTHDSSRLASLGHPSKFKWVSHLGFITAGHRSAKVSQMLHDIWQSPGLVNYIYIFCRLLPP